MLTIELNRAIEAQREALAFAQEEAATTARELAHSPRDQVILQRGARARDGAEEARKALALLESARTEAERADADAAVQARRARRASQGKAWVSAVADQGMALAQAVDKAANSLIAAIEALKQHEGASTDLRSGYLLLTEYDGSVLDRRFDVIGATFRTLDDSAATHDLLRRVARALGYAWPQMPLGPLNGHTFAIDQAHYQSAAVRWNKEIEADHA